MKTKDLIIILIAAAAVWYFFVYRKKQSVEPTTTPTTSKTKTTSNGGSSDPSNESDNDPNEPAPNNKVIKTVFADCPYCGTPNAQITRYYTNGVLVNEVVDCGNKSCPGTWQKSVGKESKKFKKNLSTR